MKIKGIFANLVILFFSGSLALAQEYTEINGRIADQNGNELAGVNIVIKGTLLGTTTNINGEFSARFNTPPPLTLIISMVGFESQEIEIIESSISDLSIILKEQSIVLGQEIVVSASRVEESIMESPVSIEKIGILDIQASASDSYYKTIANLKGVDMTTSSINFQSFNARGFNSTGNSRFVQLIDGMDTQAPALNFSIGSLTGPSDLDVESIEFIPGAASALYGPNAFNGILLISSKNPFEYQGLSAYYKQGINHIGNSNLNNYDPLINPGSIKFGPGQIKPMFEGSIRFAKSFKDKLAFKINFTFAKATDWYGTSLNDRNLLAQPTPPEFNHNPGTDRLHAYGDEVALSLGLLATNPEFNAIIDDLGLGLDVSQLPNVVVSRTPYLEEPLVDYNAKNMRGSIGVFYRLTDKLELSYNYNAGYGTTVHTGAQRYSLQNFNIQQHKIELRSPEFFLRAYSTFENSGKSYIADLTGILINDTWEENELWFGTYGASYLYATQINELPPESAHLYARQAADNNMYTPGSSNFLNAKDSIKAMVVPYGSKFADNSRMYQADAQYNLASKLEFAEILLGASVRMFDLRSNGTI
ncbi:MAG: TonB-dependent receptor, partial [Bacteroidota bacterium]